MALERIRLLPTIACCLAALLLLKVVHIWTGIEAIGAARAGTSAEATPSAGAGDDHGEEGAGHAGDGAKPVEAISKAADLAPSDDHEDPHTDGVSDEHAPGDHQEVEGDTIKKRKIPGEDEVVSATELAVLESLAARREALDKRSSDLDLKENLLKATEQRIDGKIAELKALEAEIKSSLDSLTEQEEAQTKSLVKVYETMKAKDAARILESLDRKILLRVAGRLKEAKMAAILAEMEPAKAQELTVMLATKTDLGARGG